ncbi:hypothetical protein TNCV_972631 [Trichonephila clavipes]|nr:hypothetical protein TNCV_972631 [Trichonephila clavipes]
MNEDRCGKKSFLANPMGTSLGADPVTMGLLYRKRSKYFKGQKMLTRVEMCKESFWRTPVSTQGCRTI